MNKKRVIWSIGVIALVLIALLSIEQSRTFLVALLLRIIILLKKNLISLLAAFFLVNGKFILKVFIKKMALLSATGLGKRYMIEKVINHNLKIHFFDHISDDMKRLVVYVKENFKDFPIVKQVIVAITFLTSLGFVGKFMGWMLAMKVFVAKFWSVILALVLKSSTAIVYFFTDYLWGSWIAPIVEVLILSWLLELLEKIPFIRPYLLKLYHFFIMVFGWIDRYLEEVLHIPLKQFFKFLAKQIKRTIHRFIAYHRVSAWKRLGEARALRPNRHRGLLNARRERKAQNRKQRVSHYLQLRQQRNKR